MAAVEKSSVSILGVRVDAVSMQEAVEIVEGWLEETSADRGSAKRPARSAMGKSGNSGKYQIVTPNPEHLMLAQRDTEFRKILNAADLSIADGAGVVWASRFLGAGLPERVTGTDLMVSLCQRAAQKGWTVYFLGGEKGVAKLAAKRLQKRFPGLRVVGSSSQDPQALVGASKNHLFAPSRTHGDSVPAQPSLVVDSAGNPQLPSAPSPPPAAASGFRPAKRGSRSLTHKGSYPALSPSDPTISLLFVAYGAPIQEKWIARNLAQLPVKAAMGVGGGIDFVAGVQKRAPRLMRSLSLEWLWRLVTNPRRFRRILTAVIKFPLAVAVYRLKMVELKKAKKIESSG